MLLADNKIKKTEELKQIISNLKKQNKKVVFTNGCFDILHSGHLHLLEKAKSLGNFLIVGLNTDSSVRKIKGENRPINNELERARLVASLGSVDYVVFFEENAPSKILSILSPHIHVKGGDYNPDDYDNMPESKTVKDYGGEVQIVPIINGLSTTNIIEKMNEKQ